MIITSVTNEKIKSYVKLKEKKYRDESGLFMVEGEHLIREAYRKNLIKELILEEGETFSLDIEIIYVKKEVMKKLSSLDTPLSMIAICRIPQTKTTLGERILLLDGIQDPGNLGTIIRSAVAFNVSTIVLGNKTVDLYNSKVLRATQGINFYINIINDDLVKVIEALKKEKYTIYGTDVKKGLDVSVLSQDEKKHLALVIGNEGQGISPEIYQLCDEYLHIKMSNQAESLNVAVATSILLYELDR